MVQIISAGQKWDSTLSKWKNEKDLYNYQHHLNQNHPHFNKYIKPSFVNQISTVTFPKHTSGSQNDKHPSN